MRIDLLSKSRCNLTPTALVNVDEFSSNRLFPMNRDINYASFIVVVVGSILETRSILLMNDLIFKKCLANILYQYCWFYYVNIEVEVMKRLNYHKSFHKICLNL